MSKFRNRKWGTKCLILFLALCLSGAVSAQEISISGKVTDVADGSTLPGVSILVKGTSLGTVTNIDGVFHIDADKNATLVFSFIGYSTQEVAIKGSSKIDVQLSADIVGLDEVVAIGYGSVRKKDVTGSVGSISAEKLMAAPVTSLDAGLQGKIAGVAVQQTSGAPGQAMKIRIRGGNSINYSNDPLYVIDGFIGADITTINPNDIATIDILKDASATAIYGSRGANGVVLITTNAPQTGGMKVSFQANYGVSNMTNQYDIIDPVTFAGVVNNQYDTWGSQRPFSESDIAGFAQTGATDWQDLITRSGSTQNYNLNVSGGDENLKYFFSANHIDDEGVVKNTFYKRTSIRSNISGKISDWIDFKFNTYGTHTDSQGNAVGSGGTSNPIGNAARFPHVWPNRITAENINDFPAGKYQVGDIIDPNDYNNYNNHYLNGREVHPEQKIKQNQENFAESVISNLDLTFDLGLGFELFVSNSGRFNTNYNAQRTLEDNINIDRADVTASQNYGRGGRYINTDILSYQNDFGRHSLKASAVYEYSKTVSRGLNSTVNNLRTLGNEWYLMGNGDPNRISSTYSDVKMRSYMGRVNYSFADKYLLTASIRADGVSVFKEDNRWGYFPSAAAAWRISEEGFIQDIDWIYNLKLRAGYGETGNSAVGAYATLPKFDTSNAAAKYRYYMFDGTVTEGVVLAPPTSPDLLWETTTQGNVGVDFSILRGIVGLTFDYYSKKSTNVILAKSIPRYTGFNSFTNNYADISNKGFELGVDWNIMRKGDFNWSMNFNMASNKNRVEELGGLDEIFIASEEPMGIWSLVGGNNKFIVRKGESMGALYGLKYERLWQLGEEDEAKKYGSEPGEPKYEDRLTVDTDGDGVPDAPDGVYSADDRQIIGHTAPKFTYGVSTNFSWKNLDAQIACVGSAGNEIYNWANNALSQQKYLLSPGYANAWSPTNTSSTHQKAPTGSDYSMTYVVSQYVENGSFFKIANATVGYTLPSKWMDASKLGSVRFFLSADNLLVITNYSGLDPEASSSPNNSDSQAGIDAFSYPLTRTVMGGVKINF